MTASSEDSSVMLLYSVYYVGVASLAEHICMEVMGYESLLMVYNSKPHFPQPNISRV